MSSHRPRLLALLLLLALVAAPSLLVSATLLPERGWIVGFHALPAGLAPGGTYNGGEVRAVLAPVQAILVASRDPDFKARAYADPLVRYVEPDRAVALAMTPDDPRYAEQYAQEQVRLPAAWDRTLGNATAKVCVVDTGVRHTHEDLRGPRWLGGHDYVNGDADPWDDHGHGTHVAGIAVATVDNARGVAGAGNVGLHAVKVMDHRGRGTWSAIAQGITWCADHAGPNTVVSVSISGGYSQLVHDAVRHATIARGQLVVAAAGNDGPCEECVRYPARLPEVVAVVCTAEGETPCGFSSQGAGAGLAAPGTAILNTCNHDDASYCSRSGTSDSAPLVSGVAALYWSLDPAMTNEELRARLEATAQDLGRGGWDPVHGHGEVDADCLFAGRSPCLPPPNDDLARAEGVPRLPYAAAPDTRLATMEQMEPAPCAPVGATVWYSWTAPASGTLAVDAEGSAFHAVLAAYATNATTLVPLACDESGRHGAARIELDVTSGVTYAIQLGGEEGARGLGRVSFACDGCPENNAFARAAPLAATPASARQTTVGATREPGEPDPCGPANTVGATVWFRWRAPGAGTVSVDALNSGFDAALAVFTATDLGTPVHVACSQGARVAFEATLGTTYYVQAGGRRGESGDLQLSLQCPECLVAPPHDAFASPKVVVGSAYYDEVGTVAATDEPGEPQPCGLIGKTVWYAVTPHVNATGVFKTSGSDFDTVLAAYTGDGLTSLAPVACQDDAQGGFDTTSKLVFPVRAGTTYLVQAGGFEGATGALRFTFQCTPACFTGATNDMRANAVAIPLLPYANLQDTVDYGVEPGELRPGTMGATAWYRYAHPALAAPALVTVDTLGSRFDTVLAVYAGDTYVPVAYNDNDGLLTTSRLQFTALPGVTYHVQAGGWSEGAYSARGLLKLNLS